MDRLNFYTSLYSIKRLSELEETREELEDRFGVLPILVKRLISTAVIKHYASLALFERVIMQRKQVIIILPKGLKEEYYTVKFPELMRYILDNYKTTIRFEQSKDIMKLVIPNNFPSPESLLEYVINFCKEISKLFNRDFQEEAETTEEEIK